MIPEEFNPDSYERGRKYAVDLELGPRLSGARLPILGVRGHEPGKVLVALAGVHGDEYEGVRAILDAYAALDPGEMSGDLIAVPVANPPAFWNCTRINPVDGGNLAREFPGSLEGKATAAIAYHLAHTILVHGDFLLDFHSGGINLLMPTMVGYDSTDERSREAALAFGAKVIWGHPSVAPGRTISFAKSQGVPWLYTEARGAGRIHAEDLGFFKAGLHNLMVHLSILRGAAARTALEHHLYGGGDLDASMTSSAAGFFIPRVELLQKVSAGEELGKIVDLHGKLVETFQAPRDGFVVMIRALPVVRPGEAVFLITGQVTES